MKIWIIHNNFLPLAEPGSTRHYHFARELARLGHDVSVFAGDFNHFSKARIVKENLSGDDFFKLSNVHVEWFKTPEYKRNNWRRIWNMLFFANKVRKLRYFKERKYPDVIMGSSPDLFSAFASYRLAKELKVPFVFEVRDLWPETLIKLGGISRLHPLVQVMRLMEKALYRGADKIVSLLPNVGGYISQYGVSTSKIINIPNFISFDLLNDEAVQSKNSVFTFVYAGSHGLSNNLYLILEAAKLIEYKSGKSIPQMKIRFIGKGPEKASLIAKAEDISIVEFVDSVSKDELFSMLAQADAFLLTISDSPLYQWGHSPNKLFDYMAAARPIVFSGSCQYDPVFEAKAGLSVPANNPELLAKAMIKLAAMPADERNKMGLNGREYVRKNHEASAAALKLAQTLELVTKGSLS